MQASHAPCFGDPSLLMLLPGVRASAAILRLRLLWKLAWVGYPVMVARRQTRLIASGLKAGLSILRTAFHIGSSECGVVNNVCTLVLDTSCTKQIHCHALRKVLAQS